MKPVSENGRKKLEIQYIVDMKQPDAMTEPFQFIQKRERLVV